MRLDLGLFTLLLALPALPCAERLVLGPQHSSSNGRNVSLQLFNELEELARIVDITYCVGFPGVGIHKPFTCLGRCEEFPNFELVKVRCIDRDL
jgi:hypothetical protein